MEQPVSALYDIDITNLESAYFNAFLVNVGSGDVAIVLMRNSKPFLLVQASYTVAKTLGAALGQTIATLESVTGNEIMMTSFIEQKLRAISPQQAEPENA